MAIIKLQKLIEEKGLSQKEVARCLFPLNDHPDRALERHLKLGLDLHESQIVRLSALTGIAIDQLFSGNDWETSYTPEGTWEFAKGEFMACLDPGNQIAKVFKNGALIHEELLMEVKSIPLSEFIDFLDNTINNYKSKNPQE